MESNVEDLHSGVVLVEALLRTALAGDFISKNNIAHMPKWISVITMRLPEGIVHNPRLKNIIFSELGRACVVNMDVNTEVSVAYPTFGETQGQAKDDSRNIAVNLLVLMGLSPESVTSLEVFPRPVDLPTPNLSLV